MYIEKYFPSYKRLWLWDIKSYTIYVVFISLIMATSFFICIYEPYNPSLPYSDFKLGFPLVINSCVFISLVIFILGILKNILLFKKQLLVIFLIFIILKLILSIYDIIYSIIFTIDVSNIYDKLGLKNYYSYYNNSTVIKDYSAKNLLIRIIIYILAISINIYYYIVVGSYITYKPRDSILYF